MTSNEQFSKWCETAKNVCPSKLIEAGWEAGMGYPTVTVTFKTFESSPTYTERWEKVDLADFNLGEGHAVVCLED
jgi:hypothetical protein